MPVAGLLSGLPCLTAVSTDRRAILSSSSRSLRLSEKLSSREAPVRAAL